MALRRRITGTLKEWKERPNHKPLVIMGIRQCGKTFIAQQFAEENYESAITEIWEAEKKYDPAFIGYEWDDKNPRIQLEPVGTRGYIELVPVKKIG